MTISNCEKKLRLFHGHGIPENNKTTIKNGKTRSMLYTTRDICYIFTKLAILQTIVQLLLCADQ